MVENLEEVLNLRVRELENLVLFRIKSKRYLTYLNLFTLLFSSATFVHVPGTISAKHNCSKESVLVGYPSRESRMRVSSPSIFIHYTGAPSRPSRLGTVTWYR